MTSILTRVPRQGLVLPSSIRARQGGFIRSVGPVFPDPPEAGTNEEMINAILDTLLYELPFALTYPAEPETDETHNVSNQTELNSALSDDGRIINVDAGDYTNCIVPNGRDDIVLNISQNANFANDLFLDNNERVRTRGGNFLDVNLTSTTGMSHVLLDDVYASGYLNFNNAGDYFNRVSLLNSTFAGVSGAAYSGGGNIIDLIIAACEILNTAASPASLPGFRITHIERVLIARSRIRAESNTVLRVHTDNGASHYFASIENQYEGVNAERLWHDPRDAGNDEYEFIWHLGDHFYGNGTPLNSAVCQMGSDVGGGVNHVVVTDVGDHSGATQFTDNPPADYTNTGFSNGTFSGFPAFSGGADRD